eukprot:jgi/Botrbrau1/13986/Bobra.117_2s0016.1
MCQSSLVYLRYQNLMTRRSPPICIAIHMKSVKAPLTTCTAKNYDDTKICPFARASHISPSALAAVQTLDRWTALWVALPHTRIRTSFKLFWTTS